MRRLMLAAVMAVILPLAAAAPASTSSRSSGATATGARPAPVLAAFHSRFRFGSRRGYGYGYGGRRRGLLHRVVRTAIWLYILHLFFTHGGLSILLWIVIIGLVISLVRRRRRRYAY